MHLISLNNNLLAFQYKIINYFKINRMEFLKHLLMKTICKVSENKETQNNLENYPLQGLEITQTILTQKETSK